jgi:Mediator of RNA polymerase II transcription subunit 1
MSLLRYLAHLCSNRMLKEFREELKNLAFMDRTTFQLKVDLFHSLTCIENDLRSIFKMESKESEAFDVLYLGHGSSAL